MNPKNAELKTQLEDDDVDLTKPGLDFEDDELFDTESDDFGSEIGLNTPEPEEKADAPEPESEAPSPKTEPDDDDEPVEALGKPEQAPESADREPRIPKSRFDQVNERRKAAEAKLQQLEKAQRAADPANTAAFDFTSREKAYMEAVLDGEVDKALAIRQEIRGAEQAALDMRLAETRATASETTKAELALKQTIDAIQTDYPIFDGESEAFDQDITNETLELFEDFQRRGYDPSAAMERAVRYTVKLHDLQLTGAPVASVSAPAAKAPAKPAPAQVQAKLDVATQQPPIPAGRAADRPPAVMSMPEEQFDKLSKHDEAVLRGDFVG